MTLPDLHAIHAHVSHALDISYWLICAAKVVVLIVTPATLWGVLIGHGVRAFIAWLSG